ncbi:GNAT family N-acetyltransferase [Paenibacillus sp. B2(2019)]|uniref:GNAT family N-acetyltransferase n=1 Tax=Paenibacillus sp. B2(2019) TaxID=2607754 RepID=UPI0011F11F1B|nr:GNAT family N-acetyltransferase [Paenibacillus sp. B2(2019)]
MASLWVFELYECYKGAIPLYRGRRLVTQIYRHAFPILKEHHVQKCLLEVNQTNEKAIKVYSALGFQINRERVCLKGRIDLHLPADHNHASITIVCPDEFDWKSVHSFWNCEPIRSCHFIKLTLIRCDYDKGRRHDLWLCCS